MTRVFNELKINSTGILQLILGGKRQIVYSLDNGKRREVL